MIRRNLTENLDALDAAEARFGVRLGAARLRYEQFLRLEADDAELRGRAAGGFVRDGHGDLRCEHVYLNADGVKVLDGIAWSDRLRCVDVADEVCFLAWDLDRVAFARQRDGGDDAEDGPDGDDLLDAYRDRTGDHATDGLLALYQSYRGAVRAKVAALSATDDPATWWANLDAAAECVSTASVMHAGWENTFTFDGPVAILFGGRSGSGKSTLAAAVADRLGAAHLRTDALRKERLGLRGEDAAPPDAYEPAAALAVYDALLARAWGMLHDSRGVVVDGTFLDVETRRRFIDVLANRAGTLLFVWCECDDAVAEARIAARVAEGDDASDANVGVRRRQAVGFERPREEEFAGVGNVSLLVLDTSSPVDDLCDRVIDALRVAAGTHPQ